MALRILATRAAVSGSGGGARVRSALDVRRGMAREAVYDVRNRSCDCGSGCEFEARRKL
jgi:hypothetical protein